MIGRTLNLTGWLIVAVLILALIALGTCQAMNHARGQATRAEAGQTLAEGRTAAGADASVIRDQADKRQIQTTTLIKDAEDEIRNAPDRASADAAARRRVCQLTDCADARCAVLEPHPCRVD